MVCGRSAGWGLLAFFLSAGAPSFAVDRIYEIRCSDPVALSAAGGFWRLVDDGDLAGPIGAPALPWRIVTLPVAVPPECAPKLVILAADTVLLPGTLAPRQLDMVTSDTATPPPPVAPDTTIYNHDCWFPKQNLRAEISGQFGDQAVASLHWCPYRYNPVRNQLIVIRRAVLSMAAPVQSAPPSGNDTAAVTDVLAQSVVTRSQESAVGRLTFAPKGWMAPDWVWPDDPPTGITYVVVTNAALAPYMRPLVEWKARRGIRAGLATIEAIVARYPAVDAAASIREYFKAAYASGLEWALLAGDETIVPIRYAYPELDPYTGDPHQNQICDLYFGELDGNWDADGDGIYGEYFDDQAQLYPELYVGRLPFSEAAGATAIIDKLIAYERGPDDGDYLTRALSVSADQMRDWSNGQGQHALVAAAMPSSWANDMVAMVESPSGSDPAPQNPDGPTFPALLSSGFGWVNYFVHGRADGFVVRSAGILGSPLTYVYTHGDDGDGNGHLNLTAPSPRPGIHVSAACDQGAFDLDAPPFNGTVGQSVAERLLLLPQGGAVAFIGQSRWGWVSTSYKLVKKLYEYVGNDSIPNHIGVYQTLAKLAFPSYRDLVYGNNLYGDPEMPVWKTTPMPLEVSAPPTFTPGPGIWAVEAHEGASPVSGALVTLAIADSVWAIGQTDADGRAVIDLPLPVVPQVILTIGKSGHRIWTDTLPVSIIADVGDDHGLVPNTFNLAPNYPNPFNPSTILRFSLVEAGPTTLSVYDVLGRRVRRLLEGTLATGIHTCEFAGTGDDGHPLASGIYFARLEAGRHAKIQKMVLLR